jgi:hypothetical protein
MKSSEGKGCQKSNLTNANLHKPIKVGWNIEEKLNLLAELSNILWIRTVNLKNDIV